MEINKKTLEDLLNIDGESLNKIARAVAESYGVNPRKVDALTKDSEKLKAKISKLSDDEINSAVNDAMGRLDADSAKELMETFKSISSQNGGGSDFGGK